MSLETVVDIPPLRAVAPPDRANTPPKRSRVRTPTTLDGRTIVFRRVAALRALFSTSLAEAGLELTPMRRMRVETAAQTLALAELARGKYLRGEGDADLDEVIRAERRADSAVKRLGLPAERNEPKRQGLAEYLAAKHGEADQERFDWAPGEAALGPPRVKPSRDAPPLEDEAVS